MAAITDAGAWAELVRTVSAYQRADPGTNPVALKHVATLAAQLQRGANPYEEIARLSERVAEMETEIAGRKGMVDVRGDGTGATTPGIGTPEHEHQERRRPGPKSGSRHARAPRNGTPG